MEALGRNPELREFPPTSCGTPFADQTVKDRLQPRSGQDAFREAGARDYEREKENTNWL